MSLACSLGLLGLSVPAPDPVQPGPLLFLRNIAKLGSSSPATSALGVEALPPALDSLHLGLSSFAHGPTRPGSSMPAVSFCSSESLLSLQGFSHLGPSVFILRFACVSSFTSLSVVGPVLLGSSPSPQSSSQAGAFASAPGLSQPGAALSPRHLGQVASTLPATGVNCLGPSLPALDVVALGFSVSLRSSTWPSSSTLVPALDLDSSSSLQNPVRLEVVLVVLGLGRSGSVSSLPVMDGLSFGPATPTRRGREAAACQAKSWWKWRF